MNETLPTPATGVPPAPKRRGRPPKAVIPLVTVPEPPSNPLPPVVEVAPVIAETIPTAEPVAEVAVSVPAPAVVIPPPAPPTVTATTQAELNGSEHVYFKKIFNNVPFFVNKVRVPFTELGGNIGVIVLDAVKDAEIIAALDKAFSAKRSGVVRIDESRWSALKKNLPLNPSAPKSRFPGIRLVATTVKKPAPPAPSPSGNVADKNKTSPESPVAVGGSGATPTTPFKPATGRLRPKPIPELPDVAPA